MSKIPATVITGFLGAGKTTMIRHLAARADGRRLAFIINEFGEMGIDGDILKGCGLEECDEDSVVELANGCICCTVADDFLPTIEALLARPEPPDHIIIETSGLALPKPLVRAFAWPEVRTRITVDGVVAVLDGPAVAEGKFAGDPQAVADARAADPNLDHDSPLAELYEDQLACADLVVMNKIDLLDDTTRARVRAEVWAEIRDGVAIVPAAHGVVDARVLLGIGAAAEDDLDARPSHHDAEQEHDHDDFESFTLELPEKSDPAAFADHLATVASRYEVLRMKGFVAIAAKPMRLVVQGVGPRFEHYFDRPWGAGEVRRGHLVVIGESGLDQAAIRAEILDGV